MPVLKLALAKLTRRNAYLAALSAGGPRYDIDGKPAGVIGPDDQKAAAEALQRKLYQSPQAIAAKKARWEAKKAAAAAQP
jgi:ProP effector